jgi:hypothetical protein
MLETVLALFPLAIYSYHLRPSLDPLHLGSSLVHLPIPHHYQIEILWLKLLLKISLVRKSLPGYPALS